MTMELSMQFDSGLAPRLSGLLDRVKPTEVVALPLRFDAGDITIPMHGDALNSCLGVSGDPAVGSILASCRKPQIANSIVEGVPIDVIDLTCLWIGAMMQEPCEAMGVEQFAIQPDANVIPRSRSAFLGTSRRPWIAAVPLPVTSGVDEVAQRALSPGEHPGIWIVIQALADETDFGQLTGSHSDPPHKGRWSGALPARQSQQRPAYSGQIP